VNARYPTTLRLLARYSDANGESMAFHWLNPADKKKVRDSRKAKALLEAERRTFGDPQIVADLKAKLNKRAHGLIDQMSDRDFNPFTAPLAELARFSCPMKTVIEALQTAEQTTDGLTAEIAHRCSLSASTAKLDVQALTAILIACDRAERVGPYHSPKVKLK
jgi:hypothetical protein